MICFVVSFCKDDGMTFKKQLTRHVCTDIEPEATQMTVLEQLGHIDVVVGFDLGVTIDSGVSVGALTINSEDDEDDVVDVSVLECSIVSGDTF